MDPSYLGQPVPVPTAHKPSRLPSGRTLLLISGGLVALAAGAFMLLSTGDSSGELQQRAVARQNTTLRLIADGQKNITNDDLAKINSELNIVLIGDNNQLQAAVKTAGLKKVAKTITSNEVDTATFETLKDAKLNAEYDDAYQNALTQKLESLRALLQELHGKTSSRKLKTIVAAEYSHLGFYLNQLEKL